VTYLSCSENSGWVPNLSLLLISKEEGFHTIKVFLDFLLFAFQHTLRNSDIFHWKIFSSSRNCRMASAFSRFNFDKEWAMQYSLITHVDMMHVSTVKFKPEILHFSSLQSPSELIFINFDFSIFGLPKETLRIQMERASCFYRWLEYYLDNRIRNQSKL
jgi:hypothetical protein